VDEGLSSLSRIFKATATASAAAIKAGIAISRPSWCAGEGGGGQREGTAPGNYEPRANAHL
jgi:hypothetical protein